MSLVTGHRDHARALLPVYNRANPLVALGPDEHDALSYAIAIVRGEVTETYEELDGFLFESASEAVARLLRPSKGALQ